MLFRRDAHQCGKLLALRAGRDDDDTVGGVVADFLHGDDGVLLDFQDAGFLRNLDVGFDAPSLGDHFFTELLAYRNDMRHARELRREGADDEAAFHASDDFFDVGMDADFGNGEAGLFGIGRVGDKEDVVVLADGAPYFSFCGRRHTFVVVEFKVAGNHDIAVLRLHRDAHRIGNGVRNGERPDVELAKRNALPWLDDVHIHGGQMGKLLLALQNHQRGEVAGIDGRIAETLHEERDAADVVEGAVRDDEPANLMLVLLEILRVGEDVVDAGSVVFFGDELEAGVKNDDVVCGLDEEHIFADFFDAADGNDTDGIRVGKRRDDGDVRIGNGVAVLERRGGRRG